MLSSVSDPGKFRRGLMRLFPKLESIWGNTFRDGSEWYSQRRACSEQHFQTYFRLSLPVDTISKREISEFLENADSAEWVAKELRAGVENVGRDGRTRASLLLDAWKAHGREVPIDKAEKLLTGVFSVADDIDVEGDKARGFFIADNSLRIHWLMRAVLFERTELCDRSPIIMAAAKAAQLGFLANLSSSAWESYNPREGRQREGDTACFVTELDSNLLVRKTVTAIEVAAGDGRLIEHPSLARLLYVWYHFGGDEGTAVKAWTAHQMGDEHAVARLACAFTSYSWGHAVGGFGGLGDRVAKRSDRANVDNLETLMDVAAFRARLEQLNSNPGLDDGDADAISRFLKAWDKRDRQG